MCCISSLFSIHILFAFFLFQKYENSEKCLRNMHPYEQMMWQIWFWNDRLTMNLNYAGIPLGPSSMYFRGAGIGMPSLAISCQATAKWMWDRSILFSIFTSQYDSLFLLFMRIFKSYKPKIVRKNQKQTTTQESKEKQCHVHKSYKMRKSTFLCIGNS